jgi:hypothetical protein
MDITHPLSADLDETFYAKIEKAERGARSTQGTITIEQREFSFDKLISILKETTILGSSFMIQFIIVREPKYFKDSLWAKKEPFRLCCRNQKTSTLSSTFSNIISA